MIERIRVRSGARKNQNAAPVFPYQNETQKNKIWALSILSNSFASKLIKVRDIKELIKEKIDEEMFLYSYDYGQEFYFRLKGLEAVRIGMELEFKIIKLNLLKVLLTESNFW